jgi:hypothetical protein
MQAWQAAAQAELLYGQNDISVPSTNRSPHLVAAVQSDQLPIMSNKAMGVIMFHPGFSPSFARLRATQVRCRQGDDTSC